jgi:hypothetical protein
VRTLEALLIVLAIACSSSGGNDAELEKSATQAMAELNTADATFPKQITDVLTKLGAGLIMGTSGAADTIKTKILPLVDSYLATIDRAVATADAYLATRNATRNDEKSKQALEVIRKRAEGFRKARARFAELEQKARAGASADEINQGLMGIGLMLTVGK